MDITTNESYTLASCILIKIDEGASLDHIKERLTNAVKSYEEASNREEYNKNTTMKEFGWPQE